jgi:hypothetical protein
MIPMYMGKQPREELRLDAPLRNPGTRQESETLLCEAATQDEAELQG